MSKNKNPDFSRKLEWVMNELKKWWESKKTTKIWESSKRMMSIINID